MDWIISPKVNAQVAEYFGEAPANSKACTETSDKSFCDTFHAADESYWKNIAFWNTPIEQCLDGRTDVKCVPYAKWVQAWTEIKG
jgi:putative spermidine/putrescine transport system substrate-binding protein